MRNVIDEQYRGMLVRLGAHRGSPSDVQIIALAVENYIMRLEYEVGSMAAKLFNIEALIQSEIIENSDDNSND